ncbi:MAG: hypothetical protein J5808_04160 [Paludibacteraceae bacterium]|nr:hypothetical protein [Paludibacteraceae bacterium]
MKKPLKICIWIFAAAVVAALTWAFVQLNRAYNGVIEDLLRRKEFQVNYYANMEFSGRVVGKQDSLECYEGCFLRIKCSDGMPRPDYKLPGEYYEILDCEEEVVCRVSEEEYNTFQIGDSIVKKKGIGGTFLKITED